MLAGYDLGKMASTSAPFGTLDTPTVRQKIIGGKVVYVKEDHKFPISPRSSNGTPLGNVSREATVSPTKLGPITGKPNHINPLTVPTSVRPQAYTSAQYTDSKDIHNSHVHSRRQTPVDPNQAINPHPLVPPINTSSKLPKDAHQYLHESTYQPYSEDQSGIYFAKYLPVDTYLPKKPVTLERKDELKLRKNVQEDLSRYNPDKLKDLYVEMIGFDTHLTGIMPFQQLSFCLMKNMVHVSPKHLQLIAATCIVPDSNPPQVNYERVLSFIAASLKPPGSPSYHPQQTNRSHMSGAYYMTSAQAGMAYNPLTHEHLNYSEGSTKFPFGERENGKLLRMVQMQLSQSDDPLNMEKIRAAFQLADRGDRTKLSKDQIKRVAYDCRIPLQESVINQIIDRCDSSNGQYNWEQFVDFLERVQPSQTGLPIPESKKPLEYARSYGQPNDNWPKTIEDNMPAKLGELKADNTDFKVPFVSYLDEKRPRSWTPPMPMMDPADEMPIDHPRLEKISRLQENLKRQHEIDRLEDQIDRLQQQYDVDKIKFEEDSSQDVKTDVQLMPWFDRFMKLANAILKQDTINSGYVLNNDAKWITEQYNFTYSLNISDSNIETALKRCTTGQKVSVDPYLKMLSMCGP